MQVLGLFRLYYKHNGFFGYVCVQSFQYSVIRISKISKTWFLINFKSK